MTARYWTPTQIIQSIPIPESTHTRPSQTPWPLRMPSAHGINYSVTQQLHPLAAFLCGFNDLGLAHIQLRAEHPVPEATGNAEAVLIVGEVVLQVVFLQGLVESWEP
jgi:hypothetical protein